MSGLDLGRWDLPVTPELDLDPEFVLLLVQDAQVVAQELAEHLVDHRRLSLAAHERIELPLHHREGGLDVAPQMVVLEELLLSVLEVVKHPLEEDTGCARGVGLGVDERCCAEAEHQVHVLCAQVRLVRVDLLNAEAARDPLDQLLELRRVPGVLVQNANGCDHVRPDAAGDVAPLSRWSCGA